MSAVLEYALYYVGLGFKVFPLSPMSNAPLAGSNGHLDATDDEHQLRQWFADDRLNIGVATGAVSGVWVIDLDVKNGKNGLESIKAFIKPNEQTLITKRAGTASGGIHMFIKYDPARPVRNRANILPGVDIRGDGGYVCVPPSVRQQGIYRWSADAPGNPIADGTDWAYRLYDYDSNSETGRRSDRSNKVDKYRLPWDMKLDVRRGQATTVEQTTVGLKYICRCPFHDDRSASAVFWRKETNSRLLSLGSKSRG